MPLIPTEALPYFENSIYLPMLIKILERDLETIKNGPFKLTGPYITIVDGALELIRAELKKTNIYLRRNNMKKVKRQSDGTFTEYTFMYRGYEERRRYLNVRLRNRTEELISVYFAIVGT